MNDKCSNCGAWMGLHHFETMQCPKNGMEAPVGRRQEYDRTVFVPDTGDENEELRARVIALEKKVERLLAMFPSAAERKE